MKAHVRATIRSGAAAILASLLVLPGEAQSQESPAKNPLMVGTRVRILAPTVVQGRIEGMVLEVDEQSVVVSNDDRAPLKVARRAITQLEVSRGRHRQALKGMLIGAAIGAAVLAVSPGCYAGCSFNSSSGSDRAQGSALGLLGGALWGVGIGALVKADRWSVVPLEQVRVSVGPTRGRGIALSLSVRF